MGMSQIGIAGMLGVQEQSVSLWKRTGKVPKAQDALHRLIANERLVKGNFGIADVMERINVFERLVNQRIVAKERGHKWTAKLSTMSKAAYSHDTVIASTTVKDKSDANITSHSYPSNFFSEDIAKSFEFEFLDFTLEWEHWFEAEFPLYAQIKRSEMKIHLSELHGDAKPGSAVFVPVKKIDVFYEELVAKKYRHTKPAIQNLPWGRMMELTDPF